MTEEPLGLFGNDPLWVVVLGGACLLLAAVACVAIVREEPE